MTDDAPIETSEAEARPYPAAGAAQDPRMILAGPDPLVEELTWRPADEPPDAEAAVLLWIVSDLGASDWAEFGRGYWTGEAWRMDDDSEIVHGATVTHWAEPAGPDA